MRSGRALRPAPVTESDSPQAHEHIALVRVWNSRYDSNKLTPLEQRHLAACHRCSTAVAICNQSKTLEEAERRFKVFVINN